MKIYTRTGDEGETGLFGGPRVPKDAARIEAYGTVDELNAALGLARCEGLPVDVDQSLGRIQNELFNLGAELATPDPKRQGTQYTSDVDIQRLEQEIDRFEKNLPPLGQFILPGGTRGAVLLHVARNVCRRAERRLVGLMREESISRHLLIYLNRLSDLLFVLGRVVNSAAGHADVTWEKPSST